MTLEQLADKARERGMLALNEGMRLGLQKRATEGQHWLDIAEDLDRRARATPADNRAREGE